MRTRLTSPFVASLLLVTAPAGAQSMTFAPTATVAGTGLVAAVTAGDEHACALRRDATVACWGSNNGGLLGGGFRGTGFTAAPVAVPGLAGVLRVSAGMTHTCAVLRDGHVWCWGTNFQGQLGNGTTQLSTTPVAVRDLDDAVSVASGAHHTCAARRSGRVACWGRGEMGEAGPPRASAVVPQDVPGVTDAIDVAVSSEHSCALQRGGGVVCWGSNAHGELGATPGGPGATAVDGVHDAISVALGAGFACAATRAGSVLCWGVNDESQLGFGDTSERRDVNTATTVPAVSHAVEVTASGGAACARLRDGGVRCWGREFLLRFDASTHEWAPRAIPGLPPVTQLSISHLIGCGVLPDGSLRCWGRRDGGRLGQ
ncbi:MAG: hypothetical protein WCJ30_00525 [Deltaproteobacteria bacterium]